MAKSVVVGAYWGPRAEPVEACSDRLARCMTGLGTAHEFLSSWWKRGRSRRDASRHQVAAESPVLQELLLAGRNRGDFDGEVIEDLGFRVGLWNKRDAAASLSAHCGSYTDAPGLIANNFLLVLPALSVESETLYEPEVARQIMHVVVDSWGPDYAMWITDPVWDAQDDRSATPLVGWWTYLRAGRPVPSELPEPARVSAVAGGTLIQLGDDFGAVTPELALAVRADLDRAGALAPIS